MRWRWSSIVSRSLGGRGWIDISQVQALGSPLVSVANEDNSLALQGLEGGVLLVGYLGRHIQTVDEFLITLDCRKVWKGDKADFVFYEAS